MAKVKLFKTLTHVGADEHTDSDDQTGLISPSDDACIRHTFAFLSRPTVMKRLSFRKQCVWNKSAVLNAEVFQKAVRLEEPCVWKRWLF